MLSVNIEPKRERHCSSIHCARRDQIADCRTRPIRGPGGRPRTTEPAPGCSVAVAVAASMRLAPTLQRLAGRPV